MQQKSFEQTERIQSRKRFPKYKIKKKRWLPLSSQLCLISRPECFEQCLNFNQDLFLAFVRSAWETKPLISSPKYQNLKKHNEEQTRTIILVFHSTKKSNTLGLEKISYYLPSIKIVKGKKFSFLAGQQWGVQILKRLEFLTLKYLERKVASSCRRWRNIKRSTTRKIKKVRGYVMLSALETQHIKRDKEQRNWRHQRFFFWNVWKNSNYN